MLRRGPKPDPTREHVDQFGTVRVTKREARASARYHKKLCLDASPSTFIRFVLCQWLEVRREPHQDPLRFDFDPNRLDLADQREKRSSRPGGVRDAAEGGWRALPESRGNAVRFAKANDD